MSGEEWGWREIIASHLHALAYKFSPAIEQDVVIRDAKGDEVFSIAFCGGFVAQGPAPSYRVFSRLYENDDDLIGVEEEW